MLSPSKFEIHSSGSFLVDSNLLLWNLLFSFNSDKALCRKFLLTSLFHAILQFPLGKSILFAFLTNPKATLPTEDLVLIKKLNLHMQVDLTHLILQSLCWGPYLLWAHSLTYPEYKSYPCLIWTCYSLAASFTLFAFHTKGTSQTSFSN